MPHLPSLIPGLGPVAEHYLSITGIHHDRRYDYAKCKLLGLPVVDCAMHEPKCRNGESWLYWAMPLGLDLAALGPNDRLYVGAQTTDRMFRGDGLDGDNFHHNEMRQGRGADDLESWLANGNQVAVYRADAHRILDLVTNTPALACLAVLGGQPRTARKHLGWWFEQYVLHSDGLWRWNVAPAHRALASLFPA